MAELQIVGPPGCGKTTTLSRLVERGIEEYGNEAIVVTSLTKTAASELSGRGLQIPREHVGTLHSLAFRSLGASTLVYSAVDDWNSRHPSYRITRRDVSPDHDTETQRPNSEAKGDDLMQAYDLMRHRLTPRDLLPAHLRPFAAAWDAYKAEIGAIDFTDMIEMALDDVPAAPGNPMAILADEVQDYSRLEMALLRKWGSQARTLVLAGDADQAIFQWRGADPEVFLSHDVGPNRRILSQSYRVPRAVHASASRWIRRISKRIDAEYNPRDADGAVCMDTVARWKYPEPLLRGIEKQIGAGETVMVLATCDYMLAPLLTVLRREGIPFANPWRREHGAWNPLGHGRRNSVSMSQRLLAYLRPEIAGEWWAADDLRRWTAVLRAEGILRHGAKRAIEQAGGDSTEAVGWGQLAEWFEPDALARATDLDIGWWLEHLLAAKRPVAEYPVRVYRRRGADALTEDPRLFVGTIHSFKGAEADHCYLFPDLSPAGYLDYSGAGRDAVIRQMYVGMTRARETLTLCAASSAYAVQWQ